MYELNINTILDPKVLETVMTVILNYDDRIMIDHIDVSIETFADSYKPDPGARYYGINVFVDLGQELVTVGEASALNAIESRIMELDGYIQLQSRMTP